MADRDRRIPKTPPVGVRAQTARPLDASPFGPAESWDDDITPLPAEPRSALSAVDRRVKSSGHAALTRLDQVRVEVAGEMRDLDRKVEQLATKVAGIGESTAAISAQLALLIADRAVDRQEAAVLRVETVKTDLEIRRNREITGIQDASADRGLWRRVKLKYLLGVLSGIGGVWAVISALLLSGRC